MVATFTSPQPIPLHRHSVPSTEQAAKKGEPAAGRRLNITDGNQEDVAASLCPMRAAKEISVNAHLRVEREAAKEEQMFSLSS